jgi:bifunctional NMN adenylyltransferase/nudix hydrolase
MNEALTVGVYIGRFQPFHNGHLATLRSALERFDKVVVVIGSATECLTERNPWSADQRAAMLLDALTLSERGRVWITAQPDMPDDNTAWALSIQEKVTFLKKVAKMDEAGTFVTGFQKSDTEYLRYFPWWQFRPSEQYVDVSATEIRKEYFSPWRSAIHLFDKVPPSIAGFLLAYQSTWGYSYMVGEILTKGM